MPCSLNEQCTCKTEQQKVSCINWTPSRGSTYDHCDYYHQYKLPCPLTKSRRKPCRTCQYYDASNGEGRPPDGNFDLKDPEERREYYRRWRQRKRMLEKMSLPKSTDINVVLGNLVNLLKPFVKKEEPSEDS